MERLSERLQDVVDECIDAWSQVEEDIVTAAIKRLAAYEDTGLSPEEIKKAFNEEALLKLASQYLKTTPERLRELAHAEQEDRLLVLDEETALAIAAGAHGCNTNKRLFGASYMRNFRSDNPQSISYYRAIEILTEIAEKALKGGAGNG